MARLAGAGMALGMALWSGCGGSAPTPPDGNLGAKMAKPSAASPGGAAMSGGSLAARSNLFVSVFSTNEARDPFNPRMKPKSPETVAQAAVAQQVEQNQLVTALQRGFQGIYGNAVDGRELYLYGVMLREKRESILAVPVDGEIRNIRVRPVKIYRNAAELQVEGLAQTVTLPRARP